MNVVEKISRLRIETAFEVLVKARALEAQGRSIIHLEIGEPDFPTPRHIVEAGMRALDEGLYEIRSHAGLAGISRHDRSACLEDAWNQGRW